MVTKTRRRLRLLFIVAASCLGLVAVPAAIYAATTVAAPTISSGPSGPTASTSASFAFTGPKKAAFRCSLDEAAFATCSSPKSYSGLGQGAHTFAVKAVVDGTESATTTRAWVVDTVAPAALTITTKPSDPTPSATNDFAWTQPEPGATSQCSLENGPWTTCTTPYRWVIDTGNYGQHQFAVRAIDAAGNVSAAATYRFKYEKKLPTSGVSFGIEGSVSGLSIGIWRPIAITLTNPNPVPIFVSELAVTVPGTSPNGCSIQENFEVDQSDISPDHTVTVPAGGTLTLPSEGVTAPRIRLVNRPVNQDACKGVTFPLTYSGTATN